jgi:hypothetical protein
MESRTRTTGLERLQHLFRDVALEVSVDQPKGSVKCVIELR